MDVVSARKLDAGKARYDLLPARALDEVARLCTSGAAKYGDRNWEAGMRWGRLFAAMLRHAFAWWRGERSDRENGRHHLAAVAWCALALLDYELRGVGEDDRPEPGREERQV